MKSSIVFFDTSENGNRGTLRGLVIFPVFIILTLLWFFFTKKPLYDVHIDSVSKDRLWVAMIISALLIVSALGVHTPNKVLEEKDKDDSVKPVKQPVKPVIKAVVYAALVGLVVYGIKNVSMLATSNIWDYQISLIDTVWGVGSTALLGYILFNVVEKWPEIFAAV